MTPASEVHRQQHAARAADPVAPVAGSEEPAIAALPADYIRPPGLAVARAVAQVDAMDDAARPRPGAVGNDIDCARIWISATAVVLHEHTGLRRLGIPFVAADDRLRRLDVELDPGAAGASLLEALGAQCGRELENPTHRPLVLTTGGASHPAAERADLCLRVPVGDDVSLVASYDPRLFASGTVRRFLEHILRFARGLLEAPQRALRDWRQPTSVPARSAWGVAEHPRLPTARREADSIPDRFRAVATAVAREPALSGRSGQFTYAELDALTDRLAASLAGEGCSRVGLLFEHDVGGVVAVLGALKAGCAYVALDPRHPDTRLQEIVRDAQVDLVMADAGGLDRARRLSARVAGLQTSSSLPGAPPTSPTPYDVAYLLYTSGSTGRPKGVIQSHRNVVDHALTYARRTGMGPGDRVAMFARYGFDAGVMDVFGALLSGAWLQVADPLSESADLLTQLKADAPTVLHATPTVFRRLTNLSDLERLRPAVSSVRLVVLGGEEASWTDLEALERCFPREARLINGLGPTECTLVLQHLAGPADRLRPTIPVGLPVDGVELELVDEDGYAGRHIIPAAPFAYDGRRPALRSPAPTLGQHTDEVLAALRVRARPDTDRAPAD